MGHQAYRRVHRGTDLEALPDARHMLRGEPQTMHSGVDLEPHTHALPRAGPLQGRYLAVVMNHEIQIQRGRRRELPIPAYAGEQQHRPGNADGAQRPAFLDARDGKSVGIVQRPRHPLGAVTVGVGLDDRENFAIRGRFSNLLEVVTQRGDVDERARRARHE